MFNSPIVSLGSRTSNIDRKRRLFEGLERDDIENLERIDKTYKKTKMTDPVTKEDLKDMVTQITSIQQLQIKNTDQNINNKIDCMQLNINTIKLKQVAQDRVVQKISENQDKLFQFHGDVVKRLEDLENGKKTLKSTNNKTNLTAYQEKLR